MKNEHIQEGFEFHVLAAMTEGFSGSDLKELCKRAVMYPLYEAIEKAHAQEEMTNSATPDTIEEQQQSLSVRYLTMDDFKRAMQHITSIE